VRSLRLMRDDLGQVRRDVVIARGVSLYAYCSRRDTHFASKRTRSCGVVLVNRRARRYVDPGVIERACAALNGLRVNERYATTEVCL
jgi:hypothetical protein